MKSYNDAKQAYIEDHIRKHLKQPDRRIRALSAIENALRINEPDLLNGNNLFAKFDINTLKTHCEKLKGVPLSSAEISVINGLFKFAI